MTRAAIGVKDNPDGVVMDGNPGFFATYACLPGSTSPACNSKQFMVPPSERKKNKLIRSDAVAPVRLDHGPRSRRVAAVRSRRVAAVRSRRVAAVRDHHVAATGALDRVLAGPAARPCGHSRHRRAGRRVTAAERARDQR